METIYKINDRVYDGTIGLWGTIVKIDDTPIDNYPIDVDFGDDILERYTIDGRKYLDNMPVLSFTEYDLVNGGFSQVRPHMETIFKVGDPVYDGIRKRCGTIVKIDDSAINYYTVRVDFGDGVTETYYDLVNSGFSQVRPQPEIEKDQLVYVKMKVDNEWRLRYFSHFDENGKLWFFANQEKSAEAIFTAEANEYSLENPLK